MTLLRALFAAGISKVSGGEQGDTLTGETWLNLAHSLVEDELSEKFPGLPDM